MNTQEFKNAIEQQVHVLVTAGQMMGATGEELAGIFGCDVADVPSSHDIMDTARVNIRMLTKALCYLIDAPAFSWHFHVGSSQAPKAPVWNISEAKRDDFTVRYSIHT